MESTSESSLETSGREIVAEGLIVEAGRRRIDGRRGFHVLVRVFQTIDGGPRVRGEPPRDDVDLTLLDFFPLGGDETAAIRAAEFVNEIQRDAIDVAAQGRYVPPGYRGRRIIVRYAPDGGDRLPRIVGYGRERVAPETTPWEALDALTGDRRRRRPEALARRGGSAEAPALCERCGAEGAETHHVWPKRAGGGDEMTNTERLCRLCHRKAEAAARADERAIRPGLHIAVVIGLRRVVGGWCVGLEIQDGGAWRRIFASVRAPLWALEQSKPVAVLLEPGDGRRYRFHVADAVLADDDEAVDRIRERIIWGEGAEEENP